VFLQVGAVYIAVVFGTSAFIDKEQKLNFIKIVGFFLFVYSTFAIITHYLFIDQPLQDYFVNVDSYGFLSDALSLSKLSLGELWHTAFTEFQYSGSPLFYAWIGTLQKMIGLDRFYSLLFQKLNVAFLGSFIPGIVYLLCKRITVDKKAFKAAFVYGFFSFVFIYSVALMRDVHMALIYGIALYIITGDNYSLKNYVILVVLGLLAYYIRMENGLFFLAFIGIWLYKSGSNRKLLLTTG